MVDGNILKGLPLGRFTGRIASFLDQRGNLVLPLVDLTARLSLVKNLDPKKILIDRLRNSGHFWNSGNSGRFWHFWAISGLLGTFAKPLNILPGAFFRMPYIFRHKCLIDYEKTHQTSPFTPWNFLDIPLDPQGQN